MITRNAEAIAGLVLVCFAIFAWYASYSIRGSAAFFPSIIIIALGLFSVIYLARSLLAPRRIPQVFERWWIFLIVLGLTIVYAMMVVKVGYITSTVVYIPLLAWIIGFRRPVYIAVTTLTYMVCVYVLFEIVFRRPLPSELFLEFVRGLN